MVNFLSEKIATIYVLESDSSNKVIAQFTNEIPSSNEARIELMQNPTITIRQNTESTFTFSMFIFSEKWKQINDANYCYFVNGRKYVASGENAVQYNGNVVTVTAVELWYELNNKYVKAYNADITSEDTKEIVDEQTVLLLPKSTAPLYVNGERIYNNPYPRGSFGYNAYAVLHGSGWTIGICDVIVDGFDANADFGCFNIETDMQPILYNLNMMRDLYGGVFIWDSLNRVLNIRDETKLDSDFNKWKGYEIREGKNLQSISINQNNDIVTRLYPYGESKLNIKAVNGEKAYLDNFIYSSKIIERNIDNADIYDQRQLKYWGKRKLQELSKPRRTITVQFVDRRNETAYEHEIYDVGDIVRVVYIDKETKKEVVELQRVISRTYNPFTVSSSVVEIGDKKQNWQEILKQTFEDTDYNSNGQISSGDIYDKEVGTLKDFYKSNGTSLAEIRTDIGENYARILLNTSYINQTTASLAQYKQEVTNTYATISSFTAFRHETADGFSQTETAIEQLSDDIQGEISLSASYGNNTIGSNVRALISLVANADGSEIMIKGDKVIVDNLYPYRIISSSDSSDYLTIGNSGGYADLTWYSNNRSLFQVYDNIDAMSLKAYGNVFLTYSSYMDKTVPVGTWDFSNTNIIGINVSNVAVFG